MRTYERDATGRLTAEIDPLNRRTEYQYDENGNITKITRLAGTANAVSTTTVWDLGLNVPSSVTDANNNTTSYSYDNLGQVIGIKNALNQTWSMAYNPGGQLVATTDPLNHTRSFTYDGPDPKTVTDALGRTSTFFADAAGRRQAVADAMGNRTAYDYDALNRLLTITDPIGGLTRFTYDKNGNVLTHTDAKNQTTTYTYNAIGKVASKTDALNQGETRTYEAGGKLKQLIDRKGQVSGVPLYDSVGRVKTIGYGATTTNPTAFTSSVTLTWDKANRLTQIVDSQAGTITRTYDDLDRLISEVTPQGQVDTTYDMGGRRTSMTVRNGPIGSQVAQPTIGYTYDTADRLTQILQAAGSINNTVAQTIKLSYDAAGRRTKTTLANGVTIDYGYDDADQLTSLTYKQAAGGVLGNITYTYDAAGRRTSTGGTLAAIELPTQVTDALYDANNRLTRWSNATYSYDKNGNLTNDGARSYTWDARNRLQALGGSVTASFQYDATGRRIAKTISSTTTGYLYDDLNFIQELQGTSNTSAVKANLLTGSIDETFTRMTGSGSTAVLNHFLDDGNNNVIGLSGSTQAIDTTYRYEAYGRTVTGGSQSNDNTQQYTGRENDGTGLYYYRARYYNPLIARFISEDPLDWQSGQVNQYAYVGGNPFQYVDPDGLAALAGARLGGTAGAAIGGPVGGLVGGLLGLGGGLLLADWVFSKPPENAYDPNGPKAPGKPTEEDGFKDPKGGERWVPNPNPGRGGSKYGWEDANGNVWCPSGPGSRAHGGPHWDVQMPGGGYENKRPKK